VRIKRYGVQYTVLYIRRKKRGGGTMRKVVLTRRIRVIRKIIDLTKVKEKEKLKEGDEWELGDYEEEKIGHNRKN
jgi:hypothetical protein